MSRSKNDHKKAYYLPIANAEFRQRTKESSRAAYKRMMERIRQAADEDEIEEIESQGRAEAVIKTDAWFYD